VSKPKPMIFIHRHPENKIVTPRQQYIAIQTKNYDTIGEPRTCRHLKNSMHLEDIDRVLMEASVAMLESSIDHLFKDFLMTVHERVWKFRHASRPGFDYSLMHEMDKTGITGTSQIVKFSRRVLVYLRRIIRREVRSLRLLRRILCNILGFRRV
jgi:hypothetical protein